MSLHSLLGKHLGFVKRKPVILNTDGTFEFAELMIVKVGAEFILVPTMFEGKRVNAEQAIDVLHKYNWLDPDTGRAVERFTSFGEAEKMRLKRRLEAVDDLLRFGFAE